MTPALHVVCYRWGAKYVSEDVNILRAMVERNLSAPHVFHCVTDDPSGLDSRIVAHALPDLGVQGIWRKLMTFQPGFLGLDGGVVLSLDLDVVIVRSLDFVLERPEADFRIGRNWAPDGRASGCLYRLRVGSLPQLWTRFIAEPGRMIERFHTKNRGTGEQAWLDHNIAAFDFFPDGKIVSFKEHCNAKGTPLLRSRRLGVDLGPIPIGKAAPPPGAAVVSFHGEPLPRDFVRRPPGAWKRAPFVREHWRL